MSSLLPYGSETGLCDSGGRMICVGDKVKLKVEINTEFHGQWAIYEVVLRGIVPVLVYVTSELGPKLPIGHARCVLSEKYDQKLLLWATDVRDVRPMELMFVVSQQTEK